MGNEKIGNVDEGDDGAGVDVESVHHPYCEMVVPLEHDRNQHRPCYVICAVMKKRRKKKDRKRR